MRTSFSGFALAGAILSMLTGAALVAAITPTQSPLAPPPVENQASAPRASADSNPRCTIATITSDIGTNDTFLSRMTFLTLPPPPNQSPVCPSGAAQDAARRALLACKERASNPYNCVYGDMDHMFEITTELVDTSELGSQCTSYASKYIGIACQPGDGQDSCNVACGNSAADALSAAQKKCQDQHHGDCGLTNAVPVQAP